LAAAWPPITAASRSSGTAASSARLSTSRIRGRQLASLTPDIREQRAGQVTNGSNESGRCRVRGQAGGAEQQAVATAESSGSSSRRRAATRGLKRAVGQRQRLLRRVFE
jgi:hypothetical protein